MATVAMIRLLAVSIAETVPSRPTVFQDMFEVELLLDVAPGALAQGSLDFAGFRVDGTHYVTSAGSYTRTFHTLDLYWDWYYTLADFDLC